RAQGKTAGPVEGPAILLNSIWPPSSRPLSSSQGGGSLRLRSERPRRQLPSETATSVSPKSNQAGAQQQQAARFRYRRGKVGDVVHLAVAALGVDELKGEVPGRTGIGKEGGYRG